MVEIQLKANDTFWEILIPDKIMTIFCLNKYTKHPCNQFH